MFGLRADGKKLKGLDPIQRIMPHIMSARHDSQNSTRAEIRCEPFDAFIKEQRELGQGYNYMHIIAASVLRTYAEFPRLNRFIMNGRIFQRTGGIYISFVVKKSLSATAADSVVKLCFNGTESISEVRDKIDEAIKENSKVTANNSTDKLATFLTRIPNGIIKFAVGMLKFLDKHGMLTKGIISASPFHTSVFITNLKSIKGDYIYHHLYDFGTTGQFVAMGKETMQPVVSKDNTLEVGKVMNLGFVTDERFCDGFYYVSAFRTMKKYFENPKLLLEKIETIKEDIVFDYKHKEKK